MDNTRLALLLALGGCVIVFLSILVSTDQPEKADLEILKKYGLIELEDTSVEHRSYSYTLFIDGEWIIKKTLIIDEAPAVVFLAGSEVRIAEGASLLIKASVFIQGKDSMPVRIRSMNSEFPFGVFAVLGKGSGECRISGLDLSGGSADTLDGSIFSGALSIRNSTVSIENSNIHDNFGEDGMHIVDSTVEISHCTFSNNRSDQLDLDNAEGSVFNCRFENERGNANGDGLDLSKCNLRVERSSFTGMKDKGLSAGEKSKVQVKNCKFEVNDLALAAKDFSEVHVSNSTFDKNRIVFVAYQKKKKYGGALIFEMNNKVGSGQQFDSTDATSKVVRSQTP